MSGALVGLRLPLEGLGLVFREPALRRLAVVPWLLSALAVALALGALVGFAGELSGWIEGLLPWPEPGTWVSWLWVGPVRVLSWLAARLAFLATAALAVVAALLLASVAAAPFHDALSRRAEQLVEGRVEETEDEGLGAVLKEGGRAALEEARKLAFFVGVSVAILVAGFVIPGGQLLAGPALTLFTVTFLPLDYAGYTLDRRRLSFRERRRWLAAHRPAALGFGAAAFAICAVPIVNLLAMPGLVVGGTLLALRHPPRP